MLVRFVAWGLGYGASRRVTVALSCPERRHGALPGAETHHTGRLGESPRLAGRCCMHGVIRPLAIEARIVTATARKQGESLRRVWPPQSRPPCTRAVLIFDVTRRCLGERNRGECKGRWMRW